MASLNITSLPAHIDELRIWIEGQNLDLLAINESRLDPSIPTSLMNIKGYELLRSDRNRSGGGVCLYLRNSITYKNRAELISNEIEALCIKITKPHSKPYAILACYGPPDSDVDNFFNKFESIVAKLDNDGIEIFILGDLNCNLLSEDENRPTRRLKSLGELYQLTQLIPEATRITNTSRTLIDVIYTNSPHRIVKSGVIHTGISDHSLIYTVRKIAIPVRNSHKVVTTRNYTKFNKNKFLRELKLIPWGKVENEENPDCMWELWKDMFLSVADQHTPLKTKRVKNKRSPWINANIRNLIIQRDRLKRVAINSNSTTDCSSYKKCKNVTNNEIKKAKASYYKNHINSHKGNTKEIWKTINEVLARNTKSNSHIDTIKSEEMTSNNPKEISEILNTHFTEIDPKLASNIPEGPASFHCYIRQTDASFKLKKIEPKDIHVVFRKGLFLGPCYS